MGIHRYIITGAPCSGKSTVIEELSTAHNTFQEVARKVIREQLKLKTNFVPWLNNYEFSKLVVAQQIEDFNSDYTGPVFFDRGIPDIIAYLNYYDQKKHVPEFRNHAKNHRYESKVFLMSPWEDIFKKDTERRESFQEAQDVNLELIKSYQALDYEIIEVPLVNPKDRAKFILDQINL